MTVSTDRFQRGLLTLGLILSLVGVAILTAAVGVGVYRMNRWCNMACEEARAEAGTERAKAQRIQAAWDADRDARIARTSALVTSLSERWQAAATDAAQQREKINAQHATVSARVQAIPRGSRVDIPADVARVLDAIAAVPSDPAAPGADARTEARPGAVPDAAATATYDRTEFGAYLAASRVAYDDARQLWAECRAREDALLDVMRKGIEP